ncbi:Hypothetical predicted protein [Lecanosticta acicola]|uniref:Uncharacterized protein n=1 Tax=Lecanosticta acicola TaxID=111012 RepID=A0AAI9EAM4_9PEZI|nr:Hypothetical predicted protein [Lecanosticta acicola]
MGGPWCSGPPGWHSQHLFGGDDFQACIGGSKITSYHNAFDKARMEDPFMQCMDLASVLPQEPVCPRCMGLTGAADLRTPVQEYDAEENLTGMVAYLPHEIELRSALHQSCVFTQSHMNPGAFNHPCLILQQSACGHLAFCAQMTSFTQAGSLVKKHAAKSFAAKENIFWTHLAFEDGSKGHNDLGELRLAGIPFQKKSYVKLDQGFWIEYDNLSYFRQPRRHGRIDLDKESTKLAAWAYAVAETHRQTLGTLLPTRLPTPPCERTPSPVEHDSFGPAMPITPPRTPSPLQYNPAAPAWRPLTRSSDLLYWGSNTMPVATTPPMGSALSWRPGMEFQPYMQGSLVH